MVNNRLCCNGTQLIACYLADLLYRLGLRRYPPLETIVTLSSAAPDNTVRETAFKYLCDNLRSKYPHYNPDNFRDIAFIPAENEDGTCLKTLGNVRCLSPVLPANKLFQVFWGTLWKALGFSVIQDSCRKAVTELGVQQHPPTSTLIQLLETKPPTNRETARQWFENLFECIPSRCSFYVAPHITPTAFQPFRNRSLPNSPSCL